LKDKSSRSGVPGSPDIVKNIGAAVKSAREELNISIRKLAGKSGLSATAIWKIEHGQMSPSIVVLYHIAQGLGIKFTELISPVFEEEAVIYMPSETRTPIGDGGVHMERLSGSKRTWSIQSYVYTLKKGARSGKQPMTHGGEEMSFCLKGKIQYLVDGKPFILGPGDSIHFKSNLPHSWQNLYSSVSAMVNVVVPPRMV
jgi:transcriptional regulator with XRE-family HTH domain